MLTARRAPQLLFATARLVGSTPSGGVVITLPDDTSLDPSAAGRADTDAALSDWLGRNVELRSAGAEGGTYEVPLDFEHDDDWVSWQGPGLAWHDSKQARVSLLSSESVREWDARRFRAHLRSRTPCLGDDVTDVGRLS